MADFSHIGNVRYAPGRPVDIGTAFMTSLQAGADFDSQLGFQMNVNNAYEANLKELSSYVGQDVRPDYSIGVDSMGLAIGAELSGDTTWSGMFGNKADLPVIARADERIRQLREQAQQQGIEFNIKTFQEILQNELARRNAFKAEQANLAERTSGLAWWAGVAGGMIGGMNPVTNPAYFGSMFIPVGGPEAAIGKKLIGEFLLGAGSVGAVESTFGKERAAMLGEPAPNVLESALIAGLGAVAFRGLLVEGTPSAYRALERKIAPTRADARLISRALGKGLRNGPDYTRLRLSDEELLAAVRALPNSTARNMAEHQLASEAITKQLSPFGGSRTGLKTADEIISRVAEQIDTKLTGDTALGRILPEGTSSDTAIATTPQELYARVEKPELFTERAALDSVVNKAQERLTTAQAAINNRTVGDAVSLVDAPTGERVKAVEAELGTQGLPAKRRAALETELHTLISSIGADKIERAANDAAIGPKIEVKRARIALRVARKARAKVQRQIDVTGQAALDRARAEQGLFAQPIERFVQDRAPPPTDIPTLVRMGEEAAKPEHTDELITNLLREAGLEDAQISEAPKTGAKPTPFPTHVTFEGKTIRTDMQVPMAEGEKPPPGKPYKTVAEAMQEIADEERVRKATENATLPNCGA